MSLAISCNDTAIVPGMAKHTTKQKLVGRAELGSEDLQSSRWITLRVVESTPTDVHIPGQAKRKKIDKIKAEPLAKERTAGGLTGIPLEGMFPALKKSQELWLTITCNHRNLEEAVTYCQASGGAVLPVHASAS